MVQLSEEQQKIVDEWVSEGGPMLVTASAGSGKTRVLTESVRRLLEIPKANFRVLCLTFTNQAAAEMKERLGNVNRIKERASIDTIHGFSLTIIRAYRHVLGYDEMPHIIERQNDKLELIRQLFLENPILLSFYHSTDDQEKLLQNRLDCIARSKKELVFIDKDQLNYKNWSHRRIVLYKAYNESLQNQNLIDFDDILLLAWRILVENSAVASLYQRLYRYVLVDESQDLSFAQYQFIKAFCGNSIRNLLMVGDDNQSIFGFAGSSSDYMMKNFPEDFSNTKKRPIKYNYRSAEAVVKLANRIMPHHVTPVPYHFKGESRVLAFQNEKHEAEWVIFKIKELLTMNDEQFEGQVTLDKIGILARNRYIFSPLINYLQEDALLQGNYFLKSSSENLDPESTLMKIFELGSRIITNPNGSLYRTKLLNLLGCPNDGDADSGIAWLKAIETNVVYYPQLLEIWGKLEKTGNLTAALFDKLAEIVDQFQDEERFLADRDVTEWREAWEKYIRQSSAVNHSMADFRRYVAMGVIKPPVRNLLTLATIHAVKGLEFDIVFVIGMADGTFPDYRAKSEDALREERNNLYVAITRARRVVFLTYPELKKTKWGDKSQRPSQFLTGIEIESVENLVAH